MKTLLMAVDNSPVAQKVIATAIEEALAHKAQVVVLCCVDPAYSSCNQPVYIAAGEDPEDFAAAQDNRTPPSWWCVTRWRRCCALGLTRAG